MKYWMITFFGGDFIILKSDSIDASLLPAVEIKEISKEEYDEISGRKPR